MRSRLLEKEIRKKIGQRSSSSHKGDYGRVFILAGSPGCTGAAHLAGMGAMRSGAGLVTVGVPQRVYTIVARRESEVMVRPFASGRDGTFAAGALKPVLAFARGQDVMALGPGMSQSSSAVRLIRAAVSGFAGPKILDADGLNAFQGKASLLAKLCGGLILTPHAGEFVRVFGGPLPHTEAARKKRALQASRESRAVVILKGHRTVVAEPGGRFFINSTGNPGMASGGTGDVLTGVCAALAGQGLSLWDVARFSVYLHGLAGDFAAARKGQTGMVASDLLEELPGVFRKVLGR